MDKLFSEFPDITTEAWKEKINADLKDSQAFENLSVKSEEGIRIKPFYRREDTEEIRYLEGLRELRKPGTTGNGWTICQDVFPGRDSEHVRKRIQEALHGGAEAIRFQYEGVSDPDISETTGLLKEINLADTEILFQGTMRADSIYQMLTRRAEESGIPSAELRGCLGADPIGFMVSSGIPIASLENLSRLVTGVAGKSPRLRVIDVNGASLQNAGANLVQELAFSMAIASDYLSFLTGKGLDNQQLQNSIQLSLAVGPSFFMELAKLRAARILWSAIAGAYGLDPNSSIRIHSTSTSWNLTLYDPYVNILRGTTEAIAAILGGADFLTVLPFDYPYRENSSFSDRIARNAQIILREEAYLDRVSDPASGSHYIDSLTDAVCEQSWKLFQEVETMGGFRKSFESGWIQEQVNRSKKKKMEQFSTGMNKLVGTNAFPDFNEVLLKQIDLGEKESRKDSKLLTLAPFRPSAPFEKVRVETESSSTRPRILLFKYGHPGWAQARATFSGNFFACAGYDIIDTPAFSSIKEGIDKALSTKAEVIVLCSSDDEYASFAPEVLRKLDKKSLLVIAGFPVRNLDVFKSSGRIHYIHAKMNMVEKLEEFNSILL